MTTLVDKLRFFFSDKKGIVKGQHYDMRELRSSKDFVTAYVRSTGATIRYDSNGVRYHVEVWKEENGYYQVIGIRPEPKNVDIIEVRI